MPTLKQCYYVFALASVMWSLTGCVYPSKAKIEFENNAGKDVQRILIDGAGIKTLLGVLRQGNSFTWSQKLNDQGSVKIVVTFFDGTTITHTENYFTTHREIRCKITDTEVTIDVIYDGYL